VYYSLYAAILAAGGILIVWLVATDARSWESVGIAAFLLGFAVLLEAWAGALFWASLAPPQWRISRLAHQLIADGFEIPIIVALILLVVPAALLTLLLRAFGIQGY